MDFQIQSKFQESQLNFKVSQYKQDYNPQGWYLPYEESDEFFINFEQRIASNQDLYSSTSPSNSEHPQENSTYSKVQQGSTDQQMPIKIKGKEKKIRKYEPRSKKVPSTKKPKNESSKDNYEKNIVGNVMQIMLKHITHTTYRKEVEFYCEKVGVHADLVIDYCKGFDGQEKRIGTSLLHHLFQSEDVDLGLSKVLGLFMVRFLKEEIVEYILFVGRMEHKDKYLDKVSTLIHLPGLSQRDYEIISSFKNLA